MKKIVFGSLLLATVSITGCQPAIISSAIRASDRENFSMETRCEELDMREKDDLLKTFSKYDGWRLIYISEYTTGHKFGTHAAACFERPKKMTIYGPPPVYK